MSNLESDPQETVCGGVALTEPELLEPREVPLGGPRAMQVRRTLPHRDRRMIGAWCFVDHYGPDDVARGSGMRVPPHPHTGLQTVSWLLDGTILHRDSLGSTQLVRSGELNLMTAGRGIAHSEESPADRPAELHGVQLWVALPDADRHTEPSFAHHADLPVVPLGGGHARVIMGTLAGVTSPARTYTPIVGADIATGSAGLSGSAADVAVPLERTFEHAILALSDGVRVDGTDVPRGCLLVIEPGRTEICLRTTGPGRALLIGGEPFAEELVMWWNFVGRSHEDIVAARADWTAGRAFGEVRGYDGDPLPAPELPATRLKSRPRNRPAERG